MERKPEWAGQELAATALVKNSWHANVMSQNTTGSDISEALMNLKTLLNLKSDIKSQFCAFRPCCIIQNNDIPFVVCAFHNFHWSTARSVRIFDRIIWTRVSVARIRSQTGSVRLCLLRTPPFHCQGWSTGWWDGWYWGYRCRWSAGYWQSGLGRGWRLKVGQGHPTQGRLHTCTLFWTHENSVKGTRQTILYFLVKWTNQIFKRHCNAESF